MTKFLIKYREGKVVKNIDAVDVSMYQALSLTIMQWSDMKDNIFEIIEIGPDTSVKRYSIKVD